MPTKSTVTAAAFAAAEEDGLCVDVAWAAAAPPAASEIVASEARPSLLICLNADMGTPKCDECDKVYVYRI
ncbi:hypothetical protein GCM10017709_09630 [Glutamicibacter nicotianae]|uniref:Uncharacterized protein n=1 Tax=Glutamicibacter nicotianae TaxID=37929 RepID=A0ABQ0RK44_GLUNI|nr:hypothetical protein ANI01nite_13880 [Glutamicibacter nicotianae]